MDTTVDIETERDALPGRLALRPDQAEAHDAVISAIDAGIRRPLVIAPCGWGKSILLGSTALALSRRGRLVLILAHRRELLEQNSGPSLRLDPEADVGVCSASLKADRLGAPIVVGGTATVYRRQRRLGTVDAVLLDEAHHLSAGSTTMLATILERLGNPPLVGLTATPFRTDSGPLVTAGLFEQVVTR